MKNKIFLTFILALTLICLFAIGISAKEAYKEEIPSEWLHGDTFTHFIVFDGEEYFTGSTTVSGGVTTATLSGIDTTEIEEELTRLNIQASEIGVTYLTKFVFPSTKDGNTVTYVNLNSMKGNTYFSQVVGSVVLPSTVTQIHDMNQCVSNLRHIDFGKDNGIVTIPLSFANNATKLSRVDNFPTKSLTTINANAFASCYYAFHGELVINATTVASNAFNNALTNVTGLVFGPNFNCAASQAFTVLVRELPTDLQATVKSQGLALRYIEFKCDVKEFSDSFSVTPNDTTTTGAFYFGPYNSTGYGNGRTAYDNLACIILSHENNKNIVSGETTFAAYTGKNIYFKDLTGATEYVYTSHSMVAADSCHSKCERCNYTKLLDNPSHSYTKYTFTDIDGNTISYIKDVCVHSTCDVCGTSALVETISQMLTPLGYTHEEGEASGTLAHRVKVNADSIKEYERLSGETIQYGIVVAIAQSEEKGTLISINGGEIETVAGAIEAHFTEAAYSKIEVKLTGITEAALIYSSVYVVNGDKVRYISGETEDDGAIAQHVTVTE